MADKDQLLAQFQGVTGSDVHHATFFLERADWSLEMALSNFFENDGKILEEDDNNMAAGTAKPLGGSGSDAAPPAAAGVSSRLGRVQNRLDDDDDDDDDEDDDDEDEDDEDVGQAFYVGGSTASGQQVLGPPKKKTNPEKFVKKIFKEAKAHGAETLDPSEAGPSGSSNRKVFTGVGFKLGSDSSSSEKVPGAPVPKQPRHFVLKLWRNGFSLDDGELRSYEDRESRLFLSTVMMGRIPAELVQMAEGGEVHVDMEDHKTEEYSRPRGSAGIKAFSGQGHVLGGVVPDVRSSGTANTSSSSSGPSQELEKAAREALKVDESQPTSSVQIRLPDGSRMVVKVNHGHTVGDVRTYLAAARPDVGEFVLQGAFPPKELKDDSATLEAAGLLGAALLLRKK